MTAEELLAVLQSLTEDRGAIDGGVPQALPSPVTPSMPDYLEPLRAIQAQAAVPMTQRPDNYGSSAPAPVEAPAPPADVPQQAEIPVSPDAVPQSAFALTEPRTTLPPMPTPPRSVASDPRSDLLRMIVLGFMAGAGPKSGFGTGAGQGLLHAQAVEQAELDKNYKIKEAEALRQQGIFAAQQRVEHQDRQRMLAAIETRVRQMPDVETYQREMRGYGDRMVMNGFRDNNAAALMRMFPFVPPDKDPRMVEAWKGWKNNEENKILLEQQPEKAVLGTIDVNVAPRGKPPQIMRLPVPVVAKAAGEGFTEGPDGKPIVVPKAVAASGEYPTMLRTEYAIFEATYHRPPTPPEEKVLQDNAAKRVAQANPLTAAIQGMTLSLDKQRLEDLQKKANTVQLSPGQQNDLADMKTLSDLASEVMTVGKQYNWEGTGGAGYGSMADWLAKNLSIGTEVGTGLRATIANIQGTIAKLRGGTSFTPNEQRLLEQYTPTINDGPLALSTKMRTLLKFIVNKAKNSVQVATNPGAVVDEMIKGMPADYLSTDPGAGQPMRGKP